MINRKAGAADLRRGHPLTVKLGDVADLSTIKPSVPRVPRTRRKPSPAAVVAAVLADAARAAIDGSASVVSVPAAAAGDPTFLFLRSGGETHAVLGVPGHVIRSPRLRGERRERNRRAERDFELMRVAEAPAPYGTTTETHPDDDLTDDDYYL